MKSIQGSPPRMSSPNCAQKLAEQQSGQTISSNKMPSIIAPTTKKRLTACALWSPPNSNTVTQ